MDESKIQEMLVMFDAGISVVGIANEFGVSTQTTRRILKDRGKETGHKTRVVNEDAIARAYQEGTPVPDILATHKITYAVLYKILADHEIPTRKAEHRGMGTSILDRAVELYEAGVPLWSIKQDTGVAQPTLHSELHRRGVALRRPRML